MTQTQNMNSKITRKAKEHLHCFSLSHYSKVFNTDAKNSYLTASYKNALPLTLEEFFVRLFRYCFDHYSVMVVLVC